jgi:lipopolysaccharide heptosyltransferase II
VAFYPNIGDVVNQTPLLRWLKASYPAAKVVVQTSVLASELLRDNPNVDEVWTRPHGLANKAKYLARLRQRQFDLAILTNRHNPTLVMCGLAGIRNIVGLTHRKHRRLMTLAIDPKCDRRIVYQATKAIAEELGLAIDDARPDVLISDRYRGQAMNLLTEAGGNSHKPFIAMMTGASHPRKVWKAERFQKVWEEFGSHGLQTVLVGSMHDRSAISPFVEASKYPPVVLAGKLSLKETAAVLEAATVMVSNDTGPMHLGAACGTPVVGLYGPTNALEHAPYGEGHRLIQGDCAVCKAGLEDCTDHCLDSISTEQVVRACREILVATGKGYSLSR